MLKKEFISILCCPDCKGDLIIKNKKLACGSCNNEYAVIEDIPILLSSHIAKDVLLSRDKWDLEYKRSVSQKDALKLKEGFKNTYLESHNVYFRRFFKSYKDKKYLEIGCGPFFMGQELGKLGANVVGIDYSINGLKLAKFHLENEKIENYLLVCGDIANMPFKDDVFDLLYGGGVIEHFKNTGEVVKENFRVLRKGGIAFNTVPYLNFGSFTYRQIWGNIPNVSVLREIFEFVHVRVLKGKYMTYGYEYSFTKSNLIKIFVKSGFLKKNLEVGRFEVPLLFDYIGNKFLKRVATIVASSDLFWPGLYVQARK